MKYVKNGKFDMKARWRFSAAFIVCLLSISHIGCQSIKQKPFQEFVKTAGKVRKETDRLLGENASLAADRYVFETIESLKKGDTKTADELIEQLYIAHENSLKWKSDNAPLFFKAETFRATADEMNALLEQYAQSLSELADPNRVSKERFDALKKDLNDKSGDLFATLNAKRDDKGLALFSSVAVSAFEAYLAQKQRGLLRDAILKHQPTIQELSVHMIRAVKIAASNALGEYGEKFNDLNANLQGSSSEEILMSTMLSLLELNRSYIVKVKSLKALADLYEKLPDAHLELAEASVNPTISLSSINALLASAERLGNVTQQNLLINQIKTAQAIARRAEARFKQTEASSQVAQKEAKEAREKANAAKTAADADPTNSEKERKAKRLGEEASKTEAQAAAKAKAAEEAKAAVEAAKKHVEELKALKPPAPASNSEKNTNQTDLP